MPYRPTRRQALDAEIRRRSHDQARADFQALTHKLESGVYPSALHHGQRVEAVMHQEHPVVGERYWIRPINGLGHWVPATEISEVRGTPRESIVPAGMFSTKEA